MSAMKYTKAKAGHPVKYITTPLLAEAVQVGEREGFNRQIDPQLLAEVHPGKKHPVSLAMLHHHRAGEPCEPHARAVVDLKLNRGSSLGDVTRVIVDVPIDFYNSLPGSAGPRAITAEMVHTDKTRVEATERTVACVVDQMRGRPKDEVASAVNRHLGDLWQSLRNNPA